MKHGKRTAEGIVLTLPAFLIYSAGFIFPIGMLFYLSVFRWNGIPSSPMEFIGITNYINFFKDPKFTISLHNIFVFMLSGFVLILPVALFLASVCLSPIRGLRFLKSSYFMPQVISRTAIALMWYFLLYPSGGPIITLFETLGLSQLAINYLGHKVYAIYTITVINAWTYAGFNMLLFAAGLSAIPDEIYEAASIDGADSRQKLFHITLPMLHETIQLFTINCIVGCITTFEMVWATTQGGPGSASEVFGTLLYKNAFNYNNFGYSNAIGATLLLASIAATVVITRIFRATDRTA